MKRRCLAIWLLAAILLLSSSGRAAAPSGVYFTAANDHLMDLDAETMPFYSHNVLYVSSRLFEDNELGVSYARSTSLGVAMLYNSTADLRFDLAGQTAYDKQGNIYSGYAIEQGGVVFFPLNLVCRYFGLSWSYNETSAAPLIRVKNDSVILSDASFIDAAASLMQLRYGEYERSLASGASPSAPVLPVEPPPVQAAEGQTVCLLLAPASASDAFAAMDALGGAQATFLLAAEQMEDGNLLRALTAQGHAVALHIRGGSPEEAEEELAAGRERLWRAACLWLELVWYEGGGELDALLDSQGFVRVSAPVGSPAGNQSYTNRTAALLQDIGRYREDIGVLLGDAEACRPMLPGLLAGLEEGLYRVSAWRLTV
ncbi:MAG: hypothetical protein HFF69_02455 [Oscillospiraceae bacterium]|jgi:hypothetical protein|nr:hypothetical protein [Oscillospiraceae bacterium]